MLLQRLATGATGVKQARYRRGPTRGSEALLVSAPDPFYTYTYAHAQGKGRGRKERVWGHGLALDGSWNVNNFICGQILRIQSAIIVRT